MSDEREGERGVPVDDLLLDPKEFWWMNEFDRAVAFETRAKKYGGDGYGIDPTEGGEPERHR